MKLQIPKISNGFSFKWPKYLAAIIVLAMFSLAFIALYRDVIVTEVTSDMGWATILKKDYLEKIIISPLWVFVGYLVHLSVEKEIEAYKRKIEQLNGLMKGRESIEVVDVREILQDSYDQNEALIKLQNDREELGKEVAGVADGDLRA